MRELTDQERANLASQLASSGSLEFAKALEKVTLAFRVQSEGTGFAMAAPKKHPSIRPLRPQLESEIRHLISSSLRTESSRTGRREKSPWRGFSPASRSLAASGAALAMALMLFVLFRLFTDSPTIPGTGRVQGIPCASIEPVYKSILDELEKNSDRRALAEESLRRRLTEPGYDEPVESELIVLDSLKLDLLLNDRDSTRSLRTILDGSSFPRRRAEAANLLSILVDQPSIEPTLSELARVVRSPNPDPRSVWLLAAALRRFSDYRALHLDRQRIRELQEVLVTLVCESERFGIEGSRHAAVLLRQFGNAESVDLLLAPLHQEKDPTLVKHLVGIMKERGTADQIRACLPMIRSYLGAVLEPGANLDPEIAKALNELIAARGRDIEELGTLVPVLVTLSRELDREDDARPSVFEALSAFGDRSDVEDAIVRLFASEFIEDRIAASSAAASLIRNWPSKLDDILVTLLDIADSNESSPIVKSALAIIERLVDASTDEQSAPLRLDPALVDRMRNTSLTLLTRGLHHDAHERAVSLLGRTAKIVKGGDGIDDLLAVSARDDLAIEIRFGALVACLDVATSSDFPPDRLFTTRWFDHFEQCIESSTTLGDRLPWRTVRGLKEWAAKHPEVARAPARQVSRMASLIEPELKAMEAKHRFEALRLLCALHRPPTDREQIEALARDDDLSIRVWGRMARVRERYSKSAVDDFAATLRGLPIEIRASLGMKSGKGGILFDDWIVRLRQKKWTSKDFMLVQDVFLEYQRVIDGPATDSNIQLVKVKSEMRERIQSRMEIYKQWVTGLRSENPADRERAIEMAPHFTFSREAFFELSELLDNRQSSPLACGMLKSLFESNGGPTACSKKDWNTYLAGQAAPVDRIWQRLSVM